MGSHSNATKFTASHLGSAGSALPELAGGAVKTAGSQSKPRTSGLVVTGGRPTAIVHFEEEVVAFFVDSADMLGVPKSVAAIYGLCFASNAPLSFSQIDERLELSAGSISQGLRVLKGVGALKVTSATNLPAKDLVPGRDPKHREYYEPDLELRKLILRWVESRLNAQLSSGHRRIDSIITAIPQVPHAEQLRERFAALQGWHAKAQALLPVAKTFLRLT